MSEPLTKGTFLKNSQKQTVKRKPRIWSEEAKKRMFFKKGQVISGNFICSCHNREFPTLQAYGGHLTIIKRKSTPREVLIFCDECKKELPLDRQRFCSVKCHNISRNREYRITHKKENFIRKETLKLFKHKSHCELCGSDQKLNFHHKRYSLPIREEDILTICARCHISIHQPKRIPAIYGDEKK